MTDMSPLPQTQALLDILPLLARVARHMTRDADAAHDLVQDTLLGLHQRLTDGPQVDNLRHYALASLRNALRRHRAALRPMDELTESCATTSPEAPGRLACADLSRAIANLSADQAVLIRLVCAGHDSPVELARLTGVPKGTVMSRLARARRRLRADLDLAEGEGAASLCG
jgi:RNA polymerase sigma factor (sigma-70 family)